MACRLRLQGAQNGSESRHNFAYELNFTSRQTAADHWEVLWLLNKQREVVKIMVAFFMFMFTIPPKQHVKHVSSSAKGIDWLDLINQPCIRIWDMYDEVIVCKSIDFNLEFLFVWDRICCGQFCWLYEISSITQLMVLKVENRVRRCLRARQLKECVWARCHSGIVSIHIQRLNVSIPCWSTWQ